MSWPKRLKKAASRVVTATRSSAFERRARASSRAGVRQDVDADAERPDLRRLLVDAAGDAGAVQAEGERQPADAGADDGDPFRLHRPRLS